MGREESDTEVEPTGVGPSEKTRVAIRDAVKKDLHPVTAMSLTTRATLALVVAVVAGLIGTAFFGSIDALFSRQAAAGSLQLGVIVALLSAAALAIAFSPRASLQSNRRAKILMVAGVVAGWTLYLTFRCDGTSLMCAMQSAAVACAGRSFVVGGLAAGGTFWLWRKTDPYTPRISGALVGATSGIVAAATVSILCAGATPGHMAVGHWLVVPVLALAGALTARRVLAP